MTSTGTLSNALSAFSGSAPADRSGLAAAAGLAAVAAGAYGAAYLGLTRSRVNGFEHRRGRNVGFTVRVFPSAAWAAFFGPAAQVESLLTGRDVTAECPHSIAFGVPFRSPAAVGGPRW